MKRWFLLKTALGLTWLSTKRKPCEIMGKIAFRSMALALTRKAALLKGVHHARRS